MVPLNTRSRSTARTRFERDDLKRHAQDLRDFFGELAVIAEFVAGTAQATPDHLFAKQLRHERAYTDNVRHRIAIPALGEHSDAHDAAHVAARWVQRSVQLLGKLFESLWVNWATLRALGVGYECQRLDARGKNMRSGLTLSR